MPLEQGEVVIADDRFPNSGKDRRPYIVINNRNHPYYGVQYLCMSISSKELDDSVQLFDEFFEYNNLQETSFASPWTLFQIPGEEIGKSVAKLKPIAIEALTTEVSKLIDPEDTDSTDETQMQKGSSAVEAVAD